jgi:uncharacterized glyoxalase superfamily protein PhnB
MTPRLAVVGLISADLPATLAFYRRLGLEIPAAADAEAHVEVELTGGLTLAIDPVGTIRSFDPGWDGPRGGRITLAFACDSPADVDGTYADLTAAGYEGHLPPFDAFWGMRYATVHDPDGNGVDLFALLPAT